MASKKLTSGSKSAHPKEDTSRKKLVGEVAATEPGDGKRLADGQEAAAVTDTNTDIATGPEGDSLAERIRNATLSGGLKRLPDNFEDEKGDWLICKSKNLFEILYLDYREYRAISPGMVERHYKMLHEFWTGKIKTMRMGASKIQILRKYAGPEGNERTLEAYRKNLKQAYDRLMKVNGIQNAYVEIQEARRKEIDKNVAPMIRIALKNKTLSPKDETEIKNYCRNMTDFSEAEISDIIELYLKKTNSKRVDDDSDISEAEKLFYHQIRKKLRNDLYLDIVEEQDLISDLETYGISKERYEELVLKALKEIDGAEREKTFEADKKILAEFYYGLLRDFGLTEHDKLPETAAKKLFERDNSETDFFPLNQTHRQEVISATTKQYKADLASEISHFTVDALARLDQYEGHAEMKQKLMKDPKYVLLLPGMRDMICRQAMLQIEEEQAQHFVEATKQYFRIRHWRINDQEREQFIARPNRLPHTGKLRYDWLDKKIRVALFQDVDKWAKKEYQNELKLIKQEIKNELRRHIYGLPLEIQHGIEKSKNYYLARDERRAIIIELETPNRRDAERQFGALVRKSIIFNTLIPEVETELLQKGENDLFLNPDKNQLSFVVKTAKEIIDELRQSFSKVMNVEVEKETKSREIPDHLVKAFRLAYSAFISEPDIEKFIDRFQPKNKQERATVKNCFYDAAKHVNLKVIPAGNIEHFRSNILLPIIIEKSDQYRHSLQKWFKNTFRQDVMNLGAAYGLSESQVEDELENVEISYRSWTLPRWGQFVLYFLGIGFGLLALRFAASFAGAGDWSFVEPVQWRYLELWEGWVYKIFTDFQSWIAFPTFDFSGKHNQWAAFFKVIAKIVLFVIYMIWLVIALILNAIPFIIYVVNNLFIGLYNVFAFLAFALGNLALVLGNVLLFLYYGISFIVSGGDYFLFWDRQVDIILPWVVFVMLLGFCIAFFVSTRGLRRSYTKSVVSTWLLLFVMILASGYFSYNNVVAATAEITGSYRYFPEIKPKTQQASTVQTAKISFHNGAVIRARPSTSATRLAALANGTKIDIIQRVGDWYKITFFANRQKKNGYVFHSLIEEDMPNIKQEETQKGRAAYAIVSSDNMIVRAGPTIVSPVLDRVAIDTRLDILSEQGNWVNVKFVHPNDSLQTEKRGFVYKQH